LLVLAIAVASLAWAMPGRAPADTCRSLNDGGEVFGQINGPEDPEDYCFEVQLGEEQELRQIDDRHVGAFYNTGQQGFVISAEEASDAVGANVPTTLALTGPNVVTLTVHHREGNPLASGASFDYPVVAGPGWEGGFHTSEVQMSPPELPPPAAAASEPACTVPDLNHKSLKGARRVLRSAGCALGPVHGDRRRGAKIVRQYRPIGKVLPAGTEVGVRLGR
jgi:hypothetical protein